MSRLLIPILTFFLYAGSTVFAQQSGILVKGSFMGQTRHMILNDLGEQYGLEVDFDPEKVTNGLVKPMFLIDEPIENVLDRLLKDLDLPLRNR